MTRKISIQELVLQDAARVARHAQDLHMGVPAYLDRVQEALDWTSPDPGPAAAAPGEQLDPVKVVPIIDGETGRPLAAPAPGSADAALQVLKKPVGPARILESCARCKRDTPIEFLDWSEKVTGQRLCGSCRYTYKSGQLPDQAG